MSRNRLARGVGLVVLLCSMVAGMLVNTPRVFAASGPGPDLIIGGGAKSCLTFSKVSWFQPGDRMSLTVSGVLTNNCGEEALAVVITTTSSGTCGDVMIPKTSGSDPTNMLDGQSGVLNTVSRGACYTCVNHKPVPLPYSATFKVTAHGVGATSSDSLTETNPQFSGPWQMNTDPTLLPVTCV